ncbi:MAG: NlpC/P60 family protein [Paenibacillaceae bacterium]
MGFKYKFNYQKWLRSFMIFILLLCLTVQMACTQIGNDSAAQSPKVKSKTLSLHSPNGKLELNQNQDQNKLSMVMQNGVQYVNAKQLVDLLGFQSKWDAESSSFLVGDNDVNFVLKINSREAQKEGKAIKLASPPIILNHSTYVPLSAIGDLFQQDMSYVVNDNQLILLGNEKDSNFSIKSVNDQANDKLNGDYLNFEDDPDDPNKFESQTSSALTNHISVMKDLEDNDSIVAALAHANIPLLINKSKQYLGVKYVFGAKPYPKSGAFDCSSYTQYIFGKYGIKLNRFARDQAKQGITVSRKNLRVGDLLFFNVPGRFKSSNTVGHVGIYLGNNKMINADTRPINGVQITNIDKRYWKSVFHSAKRVAS